MSRLKSIYLFFLPGLRVTGFFLLATSAIAVGLYYYNYYMSDSVGHANRLRKEAQDAFLEGDLNQAKVLSYQAAALHTRIELPEEEANDYYLLGLMLHRVAGETRNAEEKAEYYSAASAELQKAKIIFTRQNNPLRALDASRDLLGLDIERNNYQGALLMAREAAALARQVKRDYTLLPMLSLLGEVEAKNNNTKEACAAWKEAAALPVPELENHFMVAKLRTEHNYVNEKLASQCKSK